MTDHGGHGVAKMPFKDHPSCALLVCDQVHCELAQKLAACSEGRLVEMVDHFAVVVQRVAEYCWRKPLVRGADLDLPPLDQRGAVPGRRPLHGAKQ
eukprot:10232138-Heterocapsa_arctica.AAC.1